MMNLIPIPVSVLPADGFFKLEPSSKIFVSPGTNEMFFLGQYLAGLLRPATGFELPVFISEGNLLAGAIHLTTQDADTNLGLEGYTLTISDLKIQVAALQPAGVFYGIQTLHQIFPSDIESDSARPRPWVITAATIRDWPRYQWRGAMLDIARHFFGKADLKKIH